MVIDLYLLLYQADSSPDIFADELLAHFKGFVQDIDPPFIINLSDEVNDVLSLTCNQMMEEMSNDELVEMLRREYLRKLTRYRPRTKGANLFL